MKEIFIKTQKTARVFSENSENKKAEEVVIALHGYAQLPSFFIRKFSEIASSQRAIYAPEGLSKFYWNGMSGRVVASWMTKEDRANEIADQKVYLNKILKQIKENHPLAKITVLGFSQGSATASRWLATETTGVSRFIIWAGDIPEDSWSSDLLKSIHIDLVLGNEDEYISQEINAERARNYTKNGFHFTQTNYQGTHKIEVKTLKKLFSQ